MDACVQFFSWLITTLADLSVVVLSRHQLGGEAPEGQRGGHVAGAGDGGQERGVRHQQPAGSPHPPEAVPPHI